jgi:hypothetical protein
MVYFSEASPPDQPQGPAPVFAEYPKIMVHPAARRAESRGPIDPTKSSLEVIPSGDFMPPVTVHNEEQEALHASQGYRLGGSSSAAAFAQMTAAPAGPAYEPERYPMWVGDVLVESAEQEAQVLAAKAEPEAVEDIPAPWLTEDLKAVTPRHKRTPVKRPAAPI